MSDRPVHFEVFSRQHPQSGWVLQMACEDREAALQGAEDLLISSKAVAIRVTKEVLDTQSGEFNSYTILNKGMPESKKKVKTGPRSDAICTGPQDLYTIVAREKIARILEDWLKRNGVTAFELLHRPDLAEKLDASGHELQHAVQKLAVPEAAETGQSVHDLIRRWQELIDRATTRVMADGRKKLFPDLDFNNFLAQIDAIGTQPEKAYVLGGAVARLLTGVKKPAAKLEALLAPISILCENLEGRQWALDVFEIPVFEIFASRLSLAEVMGTDHLVENPTPQPSPTLKAELDLGTSLCMLIQIASGLEVEMVSRIDPNIAKVMPNLCGALAGYAKLIKAGHLLDLSISVSRRLMQELKTKRRLKPSDPMAEIETLRALAMIMTTAAKEDLHRDDVSQAFTDRSSMLVCVDFVDRLLSEAENAFDASQKLIWLCENVVGGANKRQAARWLISHFSALKFEREMTSDLATPTQNLKKLAQLSQRVIKAKLQEKDSQDALEKLGQIGMVIAKNTQLFAQVLKSNASLVQKLSLFLGLASGQSAPLGGVSEAAKIEVVKLMRNPQLRGELGGQPQLLGQLMPMMKQAGLAA